jgi:ABC-type arginine transport system permease subunit
MEDCSRLYDKHANNIVQNKPFWDGTFTKGGCSDAYGKTTFGGLSQMLRKGNIEAHEVQCLTNTHPAAHQQDK